MKQTKKTTIKRMRVTLDKKNMLRDEIEKQIK
jgi:hypothetical protein